ncbi:NAD(P)H-dependent FMN reductase OS=Castellaniella defragrans OX=75697 GN=HNR28_001076 PE=4 SV=1 [Castellaniella denitrificans]|jgi:NAD(P)H-dependent FMN reductase|uniref:NADPH-dependent FMN reductase n=1 Tax=Castellaniella denitrificans TaxID=56119 RepID=UPI003618DE95
MPLKLQVIICSTRPGRVGPAVARWFHEFARGHGQFDAELVDLADFHLPLYDEPVHPRMQQYAHDHTKRWSASVARADAYVFVTPEYNYSAPPSLVNALDFVYKEWNYKPCGFVGYGGVSGGLRAVQSAKPQVTTLKMMPMMEGVAIPMVAKHIQENGEFASNELIDASATALLDELLRWATALKTMRA